MTQNDPGCDNGAALTLDEARRSLARRLMAAGIDSATLDARVLMEGVCGRNAAASSCLSASDKAKVAEFASRRLVGEPVWRILGEREFWSLTFKLSPATLEPRPDSETLIEAALAHLSSKRDRPLSILDLGTGTGCLLIALLSEFRQARGLGIDLSQQACDTASANAQANGVADRVVFQQGDWTRGLQGRFDLIVSNPPYIPRADIETLAVEVREHDPRLALDGGEDGLDAYRLFADALPALLASDGLIVLEIGAGQEADVTALMTASGLKALLPRHDLGGHVRALIFTR